MDTVSNSRGTTIDRTRETIKSECFFILRRKDEPFTLPNEDDVIQNEDAHEDDNVTLQRAAELLWKLLQGGKKVEFHGNVSLSREEIPEQLFLFIKLILAGNVEASGVREDKITRDAISVSNVIINAFKTNRQVKYKPKIQAISI